MVYRNDFKDQVIWIVGASSGIGEALAVHLSQQGAKLVLSARRADALESLNASLGGKHTCLPLDVADAEAVAKAANDVTQRYSRIDRTLMLASIYEPGKIKDMDLARASTLVDVNLKGCFNLVGAVLPILRQQGEGQLALTASIAGYIGLPNSQPYAATKAATINLAESLAMETPKSIDIKVVNPGFVETPMTSKNDFKMPMILTPQDAAEELAKGLQSRKFEVHFPKSFTRLLKFVSGLPYALAFPILRRLAKS